MRLDGRPQALLGGSTAPSASPTPIAHLPVGIEERDAWLSCMEYALGQQPYPEDLRRYLLTELAVPAERIRVVVEQRSLLLSS